MLIGKLDTNYNKTIHYFFEQQAKKTPENIAVTYGDKELTYKELNDAANLLARYLIDNSKGRKDQLIAICLERSVNLLISIIAILKSGKAYIPIDPYYPEERINYILKEINAKTILVSGHTEKKLKKLHNAQYINLKQFFEHYKAKIKHLDNINLKIESARLAYVIYTSGTTGNPKGVMINHQGIVNRIQWMQKAYPITANDRVLQKTSSSFDVSVWELIWPLWYGACVVLALDNMHKSETYLLNMINNGISVIHFVPSMLDAFIDSVLFEKIRGNLKYIFCSGEELHLKQVKKAQKLFPNTKIINLYGPTEASIDVSHYDCSAKDLKKIFIGKPIDNTEIYILDEKMNFTSVGQIGELYISGVGLASGYYNKLELTKEKFLLNPFLVSRHRNKKIFSRIYKTGDLVRLDPSGNIEYIGRNDTQVKIRGYRIELGEIESQVRIHQDIKQCVVTCKTRGDSKYLILYYIKNLEFKTRDSKNLVNTWKNLYQEQYSDLKTEKTKLNFTGWISSYDGKPLDTKDMLLWLNSTLYRVISLNPKTILEIGSGTGLILFNMLGKFKYYHAVDLSINSIEYIKKISKKISVLGQVFTYLSSADKISYDKVNKNQPYDTVIINSVAQYFPSIEYFELVLKQAIANFETSGQIFIGDLRDYRLLKCFYFSVLAYKNIQVSKQKIENLSSKEKELLISPEYFVNLQSRVKSITSIEILPKISAGDNELNNYRYDVILYINHPINPNSLYLKASEAPFVYDLDSFFINSFLSDIFIIQYPNKRILNHYNGYSNLYSIQSGIQDFTIDKLLYIYEITEYAKNKGYKTEFFVDIYSPLFFYAVFTRYDINKKIYIEYDINLFYQTFANQPLFAFKLQEEHEFSKKLRKYLENRLPEYMIPNYFIPIDKIPLTHNGKLDRDLLPDVDHLIYSSDNLPSSELEKTICQIWAEVLNLDEKKIGLNTTFFTLGGSSIEAIRIVNKINRKLKVHINIHTIFEAGTIKQLIPYIINSNNLVNVSKVNFKNTYEQILSYNQERLWFIEKYESGTNAYNIPFIFKINFNVDVNLLKKSINAVINRHEVLRTIIYENEEGNGYQKVINNSLKIKELIVSDQKNLHKKLKEDINCVFNLAHEYPIRATIYQKHNNKYISIIIHHIAIDGWSINILFKEILYFYNFFSNSFKNNVKELNLPKLNIQYRDFAYFQKKYFTDQALIKQLNFWTEKLKDYQELLIIPNSTRPKYVDYRGQDIIAEIPNTISQALRNLAAELQVSLYTVLLSGYLLTLKVFSNQNDIVIGIPTANRNFHNIENLIGFFINLLPLRVLIDETINIKQFIKAVSIEVRTAELNQDMPFNKLVEKLNFNKDTSKHPIFQVIFDVQSFFNKDITNILTPYKFSSYNVAKYDLSTVIDDDGDNLKVCLNYSLTLFNKKFINRFIETYVHILTQFLINNQRISNLSYLNNKEFSQIINQWNSTYKAYENENLFPQLFEKQVSLSSDSRALFFEDSCITYHELNSKSNQLTHYLQHRGIKPEQVIAVCLEKSFDLIISLIGILKSGAIYVPIDPLLPKERINFILKDTRANFLITHSILLDKFDLFSGEIFLVNDELNNVNKFSKLNPLPLVSPLNLAYIIYTSGSTGIPKGVMISHLSLSNLIKTDVFKVSSTSQVLQFASFTFDASIFEIFATLAKGGQLVMTYNNRLDETFFNSKNLQDTTLTVLTPSVLSSLKKANLPHLDTLILAGEALNTQIINKWKGHTLLMNAYGPTEGTVCATTLIYKNFKNVNIIGKVFDNIKIYILNNALTPVPRGVIGEIYIGGVGLARGYLNKADLTAERFSANPFELGERMYKTGDLGRYLEDGNIEYIGRIDDQVKIRGYRIELGEIEARINKEDNIKQSIVTTSEELGNKKLLAYVIPKFINEEYKVVLKGYKYNILGGSRVESFLEDLRFKIKDILPKYMIPDHFIVIDKFPLTIAGKIDKKELPKLDYSISNNNEYEEPRNEIEEILCDVWAKVLGVPRLGITNNFFRSGGDSISSIQLVSQAKTKGLIFRVKDIFNYPTIKELAPVVERNFLPRITTNAQLKGEVKLTPIQEYFFNLNLQNKNHFNQSILLRIEKVRDIKIIKKLIEELVKYHDALRMSYKSVNGKWVQECKDEINYLYRYEDLSNFEQVDQTRKIEEIANEVQKDLDIERGKLTGWVLYNCKTSYRLLIVIHHLVVDWVSWLILLEDLEKGYHQLINNLNVDFITKTNSYKDWSDFLSEYAISKELQKEIPYWLNIENKREIFEVKNEKNNLDGDKIEVNLSKEDTIRLLKEVNNAYDTKVPDILTAALSLALTEWGNEKIKVIDLESHGREEFATGIDLSRTVGWFTNIYPFNISLANANCIEESIIEIKKRLRQVPNKGIGYGILKYLNKETIKQLSHSQVIFNYLGQLENNLDNHNKIFRYAKESTGKNIAGNNINKEININVIIQNKILKVSAEFNNEHYPCSSILTLVDTFIKYTQIIIPYIHITSLGSQQNPNYEKIDYEDLNIIINEIGKI